MTNGTTGIQVAPVVEENDMSKIREIFERAASAIAQASDLAKTVNELQHTVDALKADVEKTRQNNSFLDEALSNTRKSRDEALAEASELRHKLSTTEHDRDSALQQVETISQSLAAVNHDIEHVRKDRDDAMLEAMQAKDDLEKAQAQLKAIRQSLGMDETKPEPQTVPVAEPVPQALEPYHPTQGYTEPQAMPSVDTSERIYDGDPRFSWDKQNWRDMDTGRYYNKVA